MPESFDDLRDHVADIFQHQLISFNDDDKLFVSLYPTVGCGLPL